MKQIFTSLLIIALIIITIICINFDSIIAKGNETQASHYKAIPNYELVFPNDKVNRIDIKMDSVQWKAMNSVVAAPQHSRGGKPPHAEHDTKRPPRHNNRPDHPNEANNTRNDSLKSGDLANTHKRPMQGGKRQPPPGMLPNQEKQEITWNYCEINFNNEKWDKVGIRYKGNSSLQHAVRMGSKKLSFKLDFDEFEDQYPEIKNQRLYGFKQLNLKNNFNDPSFLREKVVADLFSDFGLVSPKTSFCQVYVDYGKGPQYFGLYTLVEEVDDTVIKTQYSNQDGNLYKPEGDASTFANGSFDKQSMNKKNNKKAKDYSDVENLNLVLNSELRTTNYEQWKSDFSKIFDVDIFLKYLAANNIMQNWDTYGVMSHNYYLYHNEESGKIEWIPWDNNEAMQSGKRSNALPLSLNSTDSNWPLIRYIIDDAEWNSSYRTYLSEFSNTVFSPQKMTALYHNYQQLITSSVIGDLGEKNPYSFLRSETEFDENIAILQNHAFDRQLAVKEFLQQENL